MEPELVCEKEGFGGWVCACVRAHMREEECWRGLVGGCVRVCERKVFGSCVDVCVLACAWGFECGAHACLKGPRRSSSATLAFPNAGGPSSSTLVQTLIARLNSDSRQLIFLSTCSLSCRGQHLETEDQNKKLPNIQRETTKLSVTVFCSLCVCVCVCLSVCLCVCVPVCLSESKASDMTAEGNMARR